MGMKICKLISRGTSFLHIGKLCECSYICHLRQCIHDDPKYFPSNYKKVIDSNAAVSNFPSLVEEKAKEEDAEPAQTEPAGQYPEPSSK